MMAEHEGEHRLVCVAYHPLEDAAAHGERAGGGLDLYARLGLGELAADEAERALGEAGGELAGAGSRIIDELVDDEARLGTDREGRAVEQEHLHHSPTCRCARCRRLPCRSSGSWCRRR